MKSAILRQVPCPECGQLLSSRGLGGHRRLRHGVAPAAALPARAPHEELSNAAVLEALARLQLAVERIENRLEGSREATTQGESPAEEEARLRSQLVTLLERIRQLNRGEFGAAELHVEQPSRASALGHLRREQTRLVCRMDELRRGVPREESLWS